MAQARVKNPGGKGEGGGRAKELQGLGESDTDFADGNIIEDMRDGDAADRGHDQDKVGDRFHLQGRIELPEEKGEGKKQDRSHQTD